MNLEDPTKTPEKVSMSEAQTREFLKKKGIKPLDVKTWQPGQPLLYLFTDSVRRNILKDFPISQRPNLARIDNAQGIIREEYSFVVKNVEGQVDYLSIDADDNAISHVKTSSNTRNYVFMDDCAFTADDTVFPKSAAQ